MRDAVYWIWMQNAVRQGSAAATRLLERFSTARKVYAASSAALQGLRLTDTVMQALSDKSLDTAEQIEERAWRDGFLLTPDDTEYPELYRHLYSPPLVLYGQGTLPDTEHMPVVAIVGTRKCTDYGALSAGSVAAGLAAAGCTVISGGAVGIDAAAHRGALYGGGKTVAVQACGLDIEYPAENTELRRRILDNGGALISEYPHGSRPDRNVFRVRNRLIAGLAWGVCIGEAPEHSGALITARLAAEQNKDLFAIPCPINEENAYGPNTLIRDGATLVRYSSDVLCEYQLRLGGILDENEANRAQQAYFERERQEQEKAALLTHGDFSQTNSSVSMRIPTENKPEPVFPEGLSETCRRVFAALSRTPASPEALVTKTGLSLGEIFSALTELELNGCARSCPGQLYCK